MKAHEDAIQLDPKIAAAWNGKGNALNALGRHDEALEAFEEAIRLDPKIAIVWNRKGIALIELGRYDEALMAYEEAIRLDFKSALVWHNIGLLLRDHGHLRMQNNNASSKQCFMRADFLAWPPRSTMDIKILSSIVLVMAEDGGTGLLLERVVRRIIPEGGLLTIEKILHQATEETEVAHAVFIWLEDSCCPLQAIEKLRLRGQVLLRFGDPIMAWQVLDELDSTIEGERDLASQLYLVWSLMEYLEPYDEELDFAYTQARKWMEGEWGPADEMTYYYAGHIALLKDDFKMAKESFILAGKHPASLLMVWQIARLMKDERVADEYLTLLLAEEHRCLRAGRLGILFPEMPVPFDPNTTEGQEGIQIVLRWFEVSGTLIDLMETVNLQKHQGYQVLAHDFGERTKAFADIEQYERAIKTWKVKEELQKELERQQTTAIRKAAEEEMYALAADFAILDVAPPCSLSGEQLVERLAQKLFQSNLGRQRERVMRVILSMFLQSRLKPEQVVLLTMYAYTKAYYDLNTARTARVEKFAARTAMEALILFLLNRCSIGYVFSLVLGISTWSLSKKLVDAVQAVYGDFQISGSQTFPTYVEFVKSLHRYWDEYGDAEEFRVFFE